MPDLSFHARDDVSRTGMCRRCSATGKLTSSFSPRKSKICPPCHGTGRVPKCDTCHELMPCSGHKDEGQRLCASVKTDFSSRGFIHDIAKEDGTYGWIPGFLTATFRLGIWYVDWRRGARSHITNVAYDRMPNPNVWCPDRPGFYPPLPEGMVMVTLGHRMKTQGAMTITLPFGIPADREAEMREKIVFPEPESKGPCDY